MGFFYRNKIAIGIIMITRNQKVLEKDLRAIWAWQLDLLLKEPKCMSLRSLFWLIVE